MMLDLSLFFVFVNIYIYIFQIKIANDLPSAKNKAALATSIFQFFKLGGLRHPTNTNSSSNNSNKRIQLDHLDPQLNNRDPVSVVSSVVKEKLTLLTKPLGKCLDKCEGYYKLFANYSKIEVSKPFILISMEYQAFLRANSALIESLCQSKSYTQHDGLFSDSLSISQPYGICRGVVMRISALSKLELEAVYQQHQGRYSKELLQSWYFITQLSLSFSYRSLILILIEYMHTQEIIDYATKSFDCQNQQSHSC